MNKKRVSIVFILSLLLISPLVSAQFQNIDLGEGVREIIFQVVNFGTPFFQAIIGDYSGTDFLFGKILLLLLLIIIIKNILDKTPIGEGNKNISLLIALIVSVLSIRFINENAFFEAIFVQYGVIGISITTILPMVIFFYFVHNTKVGTFGRKMFWALYVIILGVIWISKAKEIPQAANWIYGLSMLAGMIFIFMDKTIHAYLGLSGFKKFEKESSKRAIMKVKKELDDLNEHFRMGRVPYREYQQDKKHLEDYIKELLKE